MQESWKYSCMNKLSITIKILPRSYFNKKVSSKYTRHKLDKLDQMIKYTIYMES